jgi:proton glutamate symport protein
VRRHGALAASVLGALVVALAAGLLLGASDEAWAARVVATVEPIGTLWVNAIRMSVVPLVVAILVTGIASAGTRTLGRVGGHAVALFLVLTAGSTLLAVLLAPPLLARFSAPAGAAAAALRGDAVEPAVVSLPPFSDWLTALVPTNPIAAAAEGAMLPLLVFTALLALALRRVPGERGAVVVSFFRGLGDAMFVLVGWILALAPIGVFCLVLPLAARLGVAFAGAVAGFIIVACALITLATLALYPLAILAGRVSPRRFALACAPAQAVGFGTRSSLAALPVMVDGAERELRLPAHVTGVVLPAAVALFKFGSPIARLTGTLFVATLYGIPLGPAELIAIAAAVGLLSFYSPGIPSGGLLIMAPLYMTFGLPVEGVALLIALDLIPDMFITTANVTANMTVATLVAATTAEAASETAVLADVPTPSP